MIMRLGHTLSKSYIYISVHIICFKGKSIKSYELYKIKERGGR